MAPTQVLCQPPLLCLVPQTLDWCTSQVNQRMAAAPSLDLPARKWSMDDLSSELLALIFEQLRDIDARSLALTRLVSRRLDAIITPIKYEHLRLTERIIAPQAQTYLPDALQKVYTHTRHVEADSNLDPLRIKQLLKGVKRLLTVRWVYIGSSFQQEGFWIPADILSAQHIEVNPIKLYIDNLPLKSFSPSQQDIYLKSIPTNILTSIKLASPAPPLANRLVSLKQLLLRSSKLETFFYQDRGQGKSFTFSQEEALPAFKELVLRSYDWRHTADEVEEHWDFSQIRLLRLIDVPIFEFLKSVPFDDFTDLHTLQCDDFSAHLVDRRQDATRGLSILIKQIRALESLEITCHTQQFPVDTLYTQASSLRLLRLRDHVGFSEEDRRCPTMWHGDLANLSQRMTELRDLELDMDTANCNPVLFLQALGRFPKLYTLTLHVQTVLRSLEVVHPDVDRDYDAAMRTFSALVRGKTGSSWRSITINVGGWKRHMVRRLSQAWRLQNARGIYAERCFVLERNTSGGMTVREEMAVDY